MTPSTGPTAGATGESGPGQHAAPPPPASPPPFTPSSGPGRGRLVASLVDVAITAAWFVVAGLVGGWVWSVVTTLPKVTRSGNSATVSPEELVKQVGIDGWFVVIALVGGVLSGIVLLAWRRRDPLLMVVLVALGGAVASWLMVHLGHALGPGPEIAALRKLPDGGQVREQLRLHAPGVAWIWSIGAAFGSLLYLWVLTKPGSEHT